MVQSQSRPQQQPAAAKIAASGRQTQTQQEAAAGEAGTGCAVSHRADHKPAAASYVKQTHLQTAMELKADGAIHIRRSSM